MLAQNLENKVYYEQFESGAFVFFKFHKFGIFVYFVYFRHHFWR